MTTDEIRVMLLSIGVAPALTRPVTWDGYLKVFERFADLVEAKAIADERKKHREVEMMSECMDMVRQELIDAGVIQNSVPPMMVANAVIAAIRAKAKS